MQVAKDTVVTLEYELSDSDGNLIETGDKVVVDGNHPLAGQSLNYSCTVSEVRAATKEELSHGHVHGAHGHHH